jgi:hypothetical protein
LIRTDNPHSIDVITDPLFPTPLSLGTSFLNEAGEQIGTIEQAARTLYERHKEDINREIGEQFLTFFKTLGDLQSNHLLVAWSVSPAHLIFIADAGGEWYKVTSFILRIQCTFAYEPATVAHYILGDTQVMLGSIKDERGRDAFSVMAVQVASKPN